MRMTLNNSGKKLKYCEMVVNEKKKLIYKTTS